MILTGLELEAYISATSFPLPIARGISLKMPVQLEHCHISNETEWVQLSWGTAAQHPHYSTRVKGWTYEKCWDINTLSESYFCQKPCGKLVNICCRSYLKRPGLWRQKRRCDRIDTASRASNFETRPLRLILFDALSRSTLRLHHWIESGQQTRPWSWADGRGFHGSSFLQ